MTSPDAYYSHSGKFNPAGLLLMLAAGLVVGPLVGVVYGYAVAFNPFIYINFLATIIAGGAVGMAVGKMAKPGRVRSLGACAFAGLVAGVGFQYTQWWATLDYYGAELNASYRLHSLGVGPQQPQAPPAISAPTPHPVSQLWQRRM